MNADDANTKPTIETVLERINTLGESLHAEIKNLRGDTESIGGRIDRIDARLEKFGGRFDGLDERLGRIESVANGTRSEFLDLLMDFGAWRDKLKELLPQAN
jgi:hypothetical protein